MRPFIQITLIIGLLSGGLYLDLTAQHWLPLGEGAGNWNYGPRVALGDTVDDLLYVGGRIGSSDSIFDLNEKVRVWDGNSWESLVPVTFGFTSVFVLNRSHDYIYSMGNETLYDSITTSMARWDGFKWDSLPGINPEGVALTSLVHDSLLYVGGVFSRLGNFPSPGVMSWDGMHWSLIGTNLLSPALVDPPYIYDMIFFRGNLIAGGNVFGDSLGYELDIKYYDGSNWKALPGWQNGGWTQIYSLAVYKDELYVAGEFAKSRGALGNGIVKWDGTHWYELGEGIDWVIQDMIEYKDNLYVAGLFNLADNLPVSNIARWDGSKWCSLPNSDFSGRIVDLEVWRDTLFALGSFLTVSGDTMNNIAMWDGNLAAEACGPVRFSPTYIEDAVGIIDYFNIFPNPSTGIFTIEIEKTLSDYPFEISIFNSFGQEIYSSSLKAYNKTIDLSSFPLGIYIVAVNQKYFQKIILR